MADNKPSTAAPAVSSTKPATPAATVKAKAPTAKAPAGPQQGGGDEGGQAQGKPQQAKPAQEQPQEEAPAAAGGGSVKKVIEAILEGGRKLLDKIPKTRGSGILGLVSRAVIRNSSRAIRLGGAAGRLGKRAVQQKKPDLKAPEAKTTSLKRPGVSDGAKQTVAAKVLPQAGSLARRFAAAARPGVSAAGPAARMQTKAEIAAGPAKSTAAAAGGGAKPKAAALKR